MKTNVMLDLIQDRIFYEYGLMFDEKLAKLSGEEHDDFKLDLLEELIPYMKDYMGELKFEKINYTTLMWLIRIQLSFDEILSSIVDDVVSITHEEYDGIDINYTDVLYDLMKAVVHDVPVGDDENYAYRCYIMFKVLTIKYNINMELEDLFGSMQICYNPETLETINLLDKARNTATKLINKLTNKLSLESLNKLLSDLTSIEIAENEGNFHEYEKILVDDVK